MNIHLLRSSESDQEQFRKVVEFLAHFSGPVRFRLYEDVVELGEEDLDDEVWTDKRIFEQKINHLEPDRRIETKVVKWESLFQYCSQFRCGRKIPPSEPVVLLTDIPNTRNWFSSGASGEVLDFFIHTGMWDWYVEGDPKFPIAYELISIPLRLQMFDTYDELLSHSHKQTRDCINDFCQDKRDVGFKLRSGDICPDCLKILRRRNADPLLL